MVPWIYPSFLINPSLNSHKSILYLPPYIHVNIFQYSNNQRPNNRVLSNHYFRHLLVKMISSPHITTAEPLLIAPQGLLSLTYWTDLGSVNFPHVILCSLLTHCPPLETAPPLWTVPLPVKPFFFFASFPLRRRPSVWEKFALGQRCQTEECEAESDLKTEFS